MAIRHLALFNLKTDDAAALDKALAGLRELPAKIGTIRDFSLTPDLGKRPASMGYCLICYFADLAEMEAYLVHPAHVAAVANVAPILTGLAEHDHNV